MLKSSHVIYPFSLRQGKLFYFIWIIGFFSCLLCTHFGFAQPKVKFKRYSLEEGLSQSYVFCMLQDSRGLMWFGTEDGLNKFDGYRFTAYRNVPADTTSLSYNNIRAILEDRNKNLWAGSFYGVLHRFNRKTETFQRFQIPASNPNDLTNDNIRVLAEDAQNGLWVGTFRGGLNHFDPQKRKFFRYQHVPENGNSLSDNGINALLPVGADALWVGTTNGLNLFNTKTKKFKRFFQVPGNPQSLSSNNINALYQDRSGNIWVGTSRGLDRYNPQNGSFDHVLPMIGELTSSSAEGYGIVAIREDSFGKLWLGTSNQCVLLLDAEQKQLRQFTYSPAEPTSLSSCSIYAIYADLEGGIWIGTRGGVNRYDPRLHQFRHYAEEQANPRGLPGKSIRNIAEDHQGVFWVTTSNGRRPLELNKGTLTKAEVDPTLWELLVEQNGGSFVVGQQGDLWIGSKEGLIVWNHNKGSIQRYRHNPADSLSIGNDEIQKIHLAKDGTVWLKLANGISVFYPKQKKFENYFLQPNQPKGLGANNVNHFLDDGKGKMWLGTRGGGLVHFDRKNKTFFHYQNQPNNPLSLSDNVIHGLFEDHKAQLWISTAMGICRFNPDGTFTQIRARDGLSNDYVYGILEDQKGNFWMSTNKGITRWDMKKKFRLYDLFDGLQSNEFNDGSYYHSLRTGELFFGGINGLTVFHPDSIRDNPLRPNIIISRLLYYAEGKNSSQLVEAKGIGEKKSIALNHQQKTLVQVEFAALSFSKPNKNQYAYKLEGLQKQWISLGTNREVSFAQLPIGRYTLRIKGSNGDQVWNEKGTSLQIIIKPPWWWTNLAKLLYLIGTLSVLTFLYNYDQRRRKIRADVQRLQELDVFKTRFFTNITHEFRTPLTVILGMVGKIEQAPERWFREGLTMIRRNGTQLLQLINQILDLSKLDAGIMPVHLIQGDVVAYLRLLTGSFASYAEAEGKTLYFDPAMEQLMMDFDEQKLKDVVSNLLSNAIKFTPLGGTICLRLVEAPNQQIMIMVEDNGYGIADEKLPHIFDRFYQGDDSVTRRAEGTGIGLALTHELVRLMGGTIQVKSQLGKGSIFTVVLPVNASAPLIENQAKIIPSITTPKTRKLETNREEDPELPLLLIVEDNEDVVQYLKICLEEQYRLSIARNGQLGIDQALEQIPDLIISDVMMPERDGFDLCKTLKSDMRTSHIPIILLTARADMNSRIEGLEGGADAYLTKPFHEQELEVSLRKALDLRKRLREYYGGKMPLVSESTTSPFAKEDVFVKSLHAFIEQNYQKETLTIPEIAAAMYLSEPHLRRKLKALTGMPPQDYLLHFRLYKARLSLLQTEDSVTSIAFDCGFNDPAYFSRAFSKVYGLSPLKYRIENRK